MADSNTYGNEDNEANLSDDEEVVLDLTDTSHRIWFENLMDETEREEEDTRPSRANLVSEAGSSFITEVVD